jgi:choline kinase
MKCIIMAAGRGLRINRSINGHSKTTLPIVEGVPLLRRTVDILQRVGLDDITVVVGYDYERFTEILADRNITIKNNLQYHETNSISSAYTCQNDFDGSDDLLVMNGDSYYEASLIKSVIDHPDRPVLLVDESRRHCADVKVLIRNGMVTRYDKELDQPPDAESADLVKLSAQHARIYQEALHAMMVEGRFDSYWEDVLFRMKSLPVYARDTCGLFWADVDQFEDCQRILAHIDEDTNSSG